jgi:hypothetical protein
MRGRVLQACLLLGSTSTNISINIMLNQPLADIPRAGAVEERRGQQEELELE